MLQMLEDDPNFLDRKSFRSASTADTLSNKSNLSTNSKFSSTMKSLASGVKIIYDDKIKPIFDSKSVPVVRTRVKAKLLNARGAIDPN